MGKEKAGSTGVGFRTAFWILTILASVAVLGAAALAYRWFHSQATVEDRKERGLQSADVLSTPEDFLPDYLILGRKAPAGQFFTEDGQGVSALDYCGSTGKVCLLFWASWCPDCTKQFEAIGELERISEKYGVPLVLIDRVDPERETPEAAREKMDAFGIKSPCLYDQGATVYETWGLHWIPGFVVLNQNGTVVDYANGALSAGAFEGLMRRSVNGHEKEILAFIEKHMMNQMGGIYTGTITGGSPSGRDVLSESMGLYMQCAVISGDEERFKRAWSFVQNNMMTDNLAAWYVTGAGEKQNVNSLLDDLRIARALWQAGEKWGGNWQDLAENMYTALAVNCFTPEGNPVSWASLTEESRADTISLCYLDDGMLSALENRIPGIRERAAEIVQNGRISAAFPLYYASWSYTAGEYSHEDLNTAEALYTLWNLSRAGALSEDAREWLRQQVMQGTISARYTVEGEPVPGSDYHSTAVYALAAMIGISEEDAELTEIAVRRMNRMYVTDTSKENYGSFSQEGSNIYSFDQLMPLLVYTVMNGGGSL